MKSNLLTIKRLILGVLLGFTLLNANSCNNNLSMKKVEESEMFESNGNHYHSDIGGTLCPFCRGTYRNFYTLPNEEKPAVVLFCEGCYGIWLDDAHIGFGEGASESILIEKFKRGFNALIADSKGHWSTEDEVKNSKWNSLMLKNRLFLRD